MDIWIFIGVGLVAYVLAGLCIGAWLESIGEIENADLPEDVAAVVIFWPVFLLKTAVLFLAAIVHSFIRMIKG